MAVPKLRFKEFLGDWSKSTLGNISEIFDGTHQTPKYVDSGVKFVSVENINDLYSTDKYITKDAFDADFKNKPRANDILMTRITAGEIGATAIVKNDEPLGYYVSLALIRPNHYCLSGYLNQYISTNIFKNELHKRIIHTAFPKKINLGDINDCEVSYPSKDEQTKIANFLTAVDEKISQLNEQHQLMIQYKKGVMQKIFSQEIRFKDDNGEDFGEWEEKKLSDIANFRRGSFPQPYGLAKWLDPNGMPFVQVFDVSDNLKLKNFTKIKISKLAQEKSVFVKKGTLIITIQGTIGRVAKMQYDAYVDRTLLIFQSYKIDVNIDFIKYALFLLFELEKEKADGGIIKTITKETLSSFTLQLPSIKEQAQIANFLDVLDEKINNTFEQLQTVKQWKKGLLQQMLV